MKTLKLAMIFEICCWVKNKTRDWHVNQVDTLGLAAQHEAYCVAANRSLDGTANRAEIQDETRARVLAMAQQRMQSTRSIARRIASTRSATGTASQIRAIAPPSSRTLRSQAVARSGHCVHQTDDAATSISVAGIAWRGSATNAHKAKSAAGDRRSNLVATTRASLSQQPKLRSAAATALA